MSELALIIFGQTVLGSVILIGVIQKIKEWFNLQGGIVTVITFLLGGLLGAVGYWLGILSIPVTLILAIAQGLFSAWIATGLYGVLSTKKL